MKRSILLTCTIASLIFFLSVLVASAIELSADLITKGRGDKAVTSKIYIKDTKYRMEMPGQHQYTIMRQDKNVTWVVMVDQKSYMEMPFDPKQKQKIYAKQEGEVSRKALGTETIDGHPTQKSEVTVTDGGKTEKFYEWMASDINFPIKRAAIDGSWSEEYKNIQKSVSDSVFELPSGYNKMSLPTMPRMDRMKPTKP